MSSASSGFGLDKLVAGAENLLALEAINKMLESPGLRYNPFLVFGPTGVGKSHILHVIRMRMESVYPKWNVLLASADEFADECDAAWKSQSTYEYRQQLWKLDALLIDDIHELAKRPAALEELYHTYNRFLADGRQLVFTSREAPGDLLSFSTALRTRLESGLNIPIEPPRERMMRDLIERKIDDTGIRPSSRATNYLSRELRSAREVNGLFSALHHANGTHKPITLEEVKGLVHRQNADQISIADVARAVCEYYGEDVVRVRSACRRQQLVKARQMAMYLVREITNAPLTQIGRYFGNRDHTTVLYACRKLATEMARNPELCREARTIRSSLRA